MEKKRLTLLIVIVIIVVAVGVCLGWYLGAGRSNDAAAPSEYSAVYMTSGDLYFGTFSRFPSPHITDAWYLQRGADQQVSVAPLKNVLWGPAGTLSLNPREIVWSSRLRNDSQVVSAIRTAARTPQQQPTTQPNAIPSASETAPSTVSSSPSLP